MDIAAVAAPAVSFGDVATLFGESASRVVVSVAPAEVSDLLARAAAAGVPAAQIGTVGGNRIRITIDGRVALDEFVADAEAIWSGALGVLNAPAIA